MQTQQFSIIYREGVMVRGRRVKPGEMFEDAVDPANLMSDPRCAFVKGLDENGEERVFRDVRTPEEKEGVYEKRVQELARQASDEESAKIQAAERAALKSARLEAIKRGSISVDQNVAATEALRQAKAEGAASAAAANEAAGKRGAAKKAKPDAAAKSF